MSETDSKIYEEYIQWLERAKSGTETVKPTERFEIPEVRASVMRMRTSIINFKEICEALRRDPRHVFKFYVKALATNGSIHDDYVVLKGKFGLEQLSEVLKNYVEQYVICPICKRPDTHLTREGDFAFLVCDACGARNSVKRI
ncbi:MAG: translation initiation factor IF-2 subunit beta [Thermoproteota archaeon]